MAGEKKYGHLGMVDIFAHLSCKQVDDLKGMLDDANSHQLLAIVTPMHHETARQALHDGTLGLAEPLHLVTSR